MKKYEAIGRVGGPGTFWEGYEYSLGFYPFAWMAWFVAHKHIRLNPMRMARVEKKL